MANSVPKISALPDRNCSIDADNEWFLEEESVSTHFHRQGLVDIAT